MKRNLCIAGTFAVLLTALTLGQLVLQRVAEAQSKPMDSRKGKAIVTPVPRRNVLRDRCLFVMKFIIAIS